MKIISTFDTVTKEHEVTADGAAVANVSSYEVYGSYMDNDEFGCCLTTRVMDETNKASTMTRLCASESKEGKAAKGSIESKVLSGFLEINIPTQSKAQLDIANFFQV